LRAVGAARVGVDILPDVFATHHHWGQPSAVFEVIVDGTEERLTWQQDDPFRMPIPIAVYDRDCSSVYLTQGNVAEYLPQGLDALAALAEARKRLKPRIAEESARLEVGLLAIGEDVGPDTAVYRLLTGSETSENEVDLLSRYARWTAEDEQRFSKLETTDREVRDARAAYAQHAEATEAAKRSAVLLEEAASATGVIIGGLPASLGGDLAEASSQLAGKRRDLEAAKRRAVEAAARVSLLPGTDTDAWLELMEAARNFSSTHAYPGKPFPATDEGCLCVLCQQPLTPKAAARLAEFAGAFARASDAALAGSPETSGLVADIARLDLDVSLKVAQLEAALVSLRQLAATTTARQEAEVAKSLSACEALLGTAVRSAYSEAFASIDVGPARDLLLRIEKDLRAAASAARTEEDRLQKEVLETPEAFAEGEFRELRARRWLNLHQQEMQQRLGTMTTLRLLERAAEGLSITQITNLSKRIAADLVTAPLISTMHKELAEVGLGYLRAQVVSSGRAGVTTVRLAPPDKTFKKTDMAKVLSEGEQALMGLAAFLAELGMAGHPGPIVLDDPVSGLDSVNRGVMAARIAGLGLLHQVLVMTHDVDFAKELEIAAQARGSAFVRRNVAREDGHVGVVS